MKVNGTSSNYKNQNVEAMIVFANFLGPDINFAETKNKHQITAFLILTGGYRTRQGVDYNLE